LSRAKKYLGFNDTWLILLGIPIISILISFMIYGSKGINTYGRECIWLSFIFTTLYWFGFRELIILYHKRYPSYIFTIQRLLFVIIGIIIIYLGIEKGCGWFIKECYKGNPEIFKEGDFSVEITKFLLIGLMFFIYEGIYYFNKSRLIEIEKNKLMKITAEQKLNTLKNQVNPHFLFNSLNTLTSIIPEEPDMAIKFVQEMSKTYRNILEVRDEKLIPVKQELEALESYIYLLKTRFTGKLQIKNTIEEDKMNHFILPLSLQILIENAVKHNVTSKNKPLQIELSSDEEFVIVRNNLQKKDQQYSSTKLGLANIESRYKLLVDQNIVVKETEDEFIVKLPIIRNE